jgi:hypothetical protein
VLLAQEYAAVFYQRGDAVVEPGRDVRRRHAKGQIVTGGGDQVPAAHNERLAGLDGRRLNARAVPAGLPWIG